MIAKQSKGRGFASVLRYALLERKRPEIVGGSMAGTDPESLAAEFRVSARLRPALHKPVYHVAIAFPPGERLADDRCSENDRMAEIANRYLELMGFDLAKTQAVYIRHRDTEHPHLHVVACRVALDGGVISDRHDWWRGQRACRRIEAEFGLQPVNNAVPLVRTAQKEEREMLARGAVSNKTRLQYAVLAEARSSMTVRELVGRLSSRGVDVRTHLGPDGRACGISYRLKDCPVAVRGASLGKAFTLNGLKNYLGVSHELERQPDDRAPSPGGEPCGSRQGSGAPGAAGQTPACKPPAGARERAGTGGAQSAGKLAADAGGPADFGRGAAGVPGADPQRAVGGAVGGGTAAGQSPGSVVSTNGKFDRETDAPSRHPGLGEADGGASGEVGEFSNCTDGEIDFAQRSAADSSHFPQGGGGDDRRLRSAPGPIGFGFEAHRPAAPERTGESVSGDESSVGRAQAPGHRDRNAPDPAEPGPGDRRMERSPEEGDRIDAKIVRRQPGGLDGETGQAGEGQPGSGRGQPQSDRGVDSQVVRAGDQAVGDNARVPRSADSGSGRAGGGAEERGADPQVDFQPVGSGRGDGPADRGHRGFDMVHGRTADAEAAADLVEFGREGGEGGGLLATPLTPQGDASRLLYQKYLRMLKRRRAGRATDKELAAMAFKAGHRAEEVRAILSHSLQAQKIAARSAGIERERALRKHFDDTFDAIQRGTEYEP
ncbi:relaxase/mobilization nuclease domain-containing protein (plasmid) [Gloeobacter morelensis MG652769]|nr:relaxase/mobilization nuclease domain-containing protein [Gloeobacter morelensis MG652769]